MSYSLYYSDSFNDCLRDFQQRDSAPLAKLMEITAELTRQPTQNPKLQSHPMKGVKGERRFISYVGGSKGLRLIWSKFEDTILLLLFGEHDDVERRAERMTLIENPDTGGLDIVEHAETADDLPRRSVPRGGPTVGQLFVAWADDELADFGFRDQEVEVLRRLDTEDELLALTLRDEAERLAINLVATGNPDGKVARRTSVDEQREMAAKISDVVGEDEQRLAKKVASPRSRKHVAPTSRSELERVLTKPIEDWMVFLHPDQAKLTQRPFSGPARVRGAAGTGKTVVALHRAKHLAQTYRQPILFTTYVTNLPDVYKHLFTRLAPELDGQVEFRNLHSWAYRFLKREGRPFKIDTQAIGNAFRDAWDKGDRDGTVLGDSPLSKDYYREEIDWIIKGRGLKGLENYLELPRTGRGTPLHAGHRKAVWRLYQSYENRLEHRGVVDFNDLLIRALELAQQERFESPYRAVVIDEAQDLTEVGLRLAHALAGGDQRDGLFLVGDGEQSIYPGGYNLKQIGIDVRGRSSILDVNYRNTRAILDTARQLVAGRQFDDGDDELASSDRQVQVTRDGTTPTMRGFGDEDDHDLALASRIEELSHDPDVSRGDIVVLVPTNAMVSRYRSRIEGLGLDTQKLRDYDGVTNEKVKVGTYPRAKGLEFKHVLLPRLDATGVGEDPRTGEDDQTYTERLERLRRQIWVSMTRARDGLWLGWVGEPSQLVEPCVDSATEAGATTSTQE